MRVISKRPLREFWGKHPDAEIALRRWHKVVSKAVWKKFADIRADFRSVDQVGHLVVFNIGGNKYRLIAETLYTKGKVLVRHVLTHAEYDRGDWKRK